MHNESKIIANLFLLLLLAVPLFADPIEFEYSADSTVTWGGDILCDTTWTADRSPYVIRGNVIVDTGVTWTIEPGCEFWFDPTYLLWPQIQCWGAIIAEGTAADSILFQAHPDVTLSWSYAWDAFYIRESSSDTSRFAYCRFSEAIDYLLALGGCLSAEYSLFLRGRTPTSAPYNSDAVVSYGGFVSLNECEIQEIPVYIKDESRAEVRGCLFDHTQIFFYKSFGEVVSSIFTSYGIYPIHLQDSLYRTSADDTVWILNNLIIGWVPTGIAHAGQRHPEIILHNTVVNSINRGIDFHGWTTTLALENNLVISDRGSGIHIFDTGLPEYEIKYNNSFGHATDYVCPDPAVGVMCSVNFNGDSCDIYGNISEDPMFVDTAGGDYHLRAGSPCIDAGDPSMPWDPDGTPPDIGCFYFDQTAIEELPAIPRIFEFSAYPNPFNSSCRLTFTLPAEELSIFTKIEIYDILGNIVTQIALEKSESRSVEHEYLRHCRWIPDESVPSGVYFAVLRVGTWAGKTKITLIR